MMEVAVAIAYSHTSLVSWMRNKLSRRIAVNGFKTYTTRVYRHASFTYSWHHAYSLAIAPRFRHCISRLESLGSNALADTVGLIQPAARRANGSECSRTVPYVYNGSGDEARRVILATAAQGTILTIDAPASDSSWSLDFTGRESLSAGSKQSSPNSRRKTARSTRPHSVDAPRIGPIWRVAPCFHTWSRMKEILHSTLEYRGIATG